MGYQLTPFMLLYASVFVLTSSLALYAAVRYVRYDRRLSVLAFAILMSSISFWELTSFVLEMTTSEGLKIITHNLSNTLAVPAYLFSLLFFALAFAEHERWIRWAVAAAAITAASMGVALLFDPEFLYESRGLVTGGPVTVFGFTFEEYVLHDRRLKRPFVLWALYSYALMILSAGILLRYVVAKKEGLHTEQSVLVATGVGTVIVVNGAELLGLSPAALKITEIGFGVTAITFAVAIFRYQLLELPPISRHQLVDLIDDPLVFIDRNSEVVDSNPAARRTFDVGSGWKGMDAAEFFKPHAESLRPGHGDGSSGNNMIELEESGRYFDIQSTPLRTPAGETSGRAIALREVTELKNTNRRLDQFASMVSHDLRTPLNRAMRQANRLAGDGSNDGIDGDGSNDGIDALRESMEQMESITDGMLALARAGGDVETTEECPLGEFVEEVWESLGTEGARLESSAGDTTIEADPARLFQVVENLLANAIDHNDSPVTVRVGTIEESDERTDDDGLSGFFIEDSGSGVAENEREDAFEHGYTTSRDGHGYGLSIVRRIVDAHGWEIRVTDGTDGGARFEITGVGSD